MSTPTSTTLPPQPPAQPNPLVFQPRKVVERIGMMSHQVDMRFIYELPDGSRYECQSEWPQPCTKETLQKAREAAHRVLRAILADRQAALSAHDRLAWASENQGGAA